MKKGKKILAAAGCVVLTVVASLGAWQIYVRQQSKDYNLITLDTSALPEAVAQAEEEGFAKRVGARCNNLYPNSLKIMNM